MILTASKIWFATWTKYRTFTSKNAGYRDVNNSYIFYEMDSVMMLFLEDILYRDLSSVHMAIEMYFKKRKSLCFNLLPCISVSQLFWYIKKFHPQTQMHIYHATTLMIYQCYARLIQIYDTICEKNLPYFISDLIKPLFIRA